MIGHELAVEQPEAADPEPRDQPGQRHLGGIGPPAEHALAEKRPAERQPVEPADQFRPIVTGLPAFHTMGQAARVQCAKGRFDIIVDPGVAPIVRRRRAGGDHAVERGVAGHYEPVLPDYFFQRL